MSAIESAAAEPSGPTAAAWCSPVSYRRCNGWTVLDMKKD
jgi:hypothetical protein